MSYFRNKVIAIAGGNGGMGAATARLLALRGARVSVADYQTTQPSEKLNKGATEASGNIVSSTVDVRNEFEVKNWIEETVRVFGRLDGCVNYAGIVSKDFLNVGIPHSRWD